MFIEKKNIRMKRTYKVMSNNITIVGVTRKTKNVRDHVKVTMACVNPYIFCFFL